MIQVAFSAGKKIRGFVQLALLFKEIPPCELGGIVIAAVLHS